MLPDKKATSYANDPALGTILVFCEAGASPGLTGEHEAQLLLDTKGHLVGIDVEPDTEHRLVVMLGPFEAVASQRNARVSVDGGGRMVTLRGTAAKSVAPGANPYVF